MYYWLDDHILYYYAPPDRATAWGLFDSIMKAEDVTATGVAVRAGLDQQQEQQTPLINRQCLKFERHEHSVANLMDLEEFLEPAELRAAVASQLLQELLQIPSVRVAAMSDTRGGLDTGDLQIDAHVHSSMYS